MKRISSWPIPRMAWLAFIARLAFMVICMARI